MPAPQEFDYSNLYLIEAETAVVLKCGESISSLIVKVGFKRLFVIYKYWGGVSILPTQIIISDLGN